ncbi:AraC family transcriptional regulator [Pedobacter sp. UBA5917]|uniref:AraC family transcriptional regulator n=1 Tax=Pedobacter sp. UBA5917 TaxID=1947061 RepID=UPI0025E54D78|nr:AraC family transcriptional regulator [Pedobacter sp. UBA5917]
MKENIKYYPIIAKQLFQFDHVHIRWNQQVPLHQQQTWELSYIITGSGTRMIGGHVENFNQGEIILIPPNIPHCWYFEERIHDNQGKIENICIFIEDGLLSSSGILSTMLSQIIAKIRELKNAVSFSGDTLKRLQHLLVTMIAQSEIEKLSSFILILELISFHVDMQVVGKPLIENKAEKKLQEVYLFVLSHYQRVITLDEIAKSVGMQKASFCVFFKRMTGKSFITFLTEYRINSAIQMLEKTNLTISEISHQVGFNDVPHFNRAFRRQVNTSPTQFRMQQQ